VFKVQKSVGGQAIILGEALRRGGNHFSQARSKRLQRDLKKGVLPCKTGCEAVSCVVPLRPGLPRNCESAGFFLAGACSNGYRQRAAGKFSISEFAYITPTVWGRVLTRPVEAKSSTGFSPAPVAKRISVGHSQVASVLPYEAGRSGAT